MFLCVSAHKHSQGDQWDSGGSHASTSAAGCRLTTEGWEKGNQILSSPGPLTAGGISGRESRPALRGGPTERPRDELGDIWGSFDDGLIGVTRLSGLLAAFQRCVRKCCSRFFFLALISQRSPVGGRSGRRGPSRCSLTFLIFTFVHFTPKAKNTPRRAGASRVPTQRKGRRGGVTRGPWRRTRFNIAPRLATRPGGSMAFRRRSLLQR